MTSAVNWRMHSQLLSIHPPLKLSTSGESMCWLWHPYKTRVEFPLTQPVCWRAVKITATSSFGGSGNSFSHGHWPVCMDILSASAWYKISYICLFLTNLEHGRSHWANIPAIHVPSTCLQNQCPPIFCNHEFKFNIVFEANSNHFNYCALFDDLCDADVWSHLNSIITHPTGSHTRDRNPFVQITKPK